MISMQRWLLAVAGTVMLVWQSPIMAQDLPDFADLVEEASPAVVNISTRQAISEGRSAGMPPGMPDLEGLPPIFREFFEHGMPQQSPSVPQRRQAPQSLGSGFIISADGYVLTNNHVVAGADEIFVRLSDRRELEAELVGADPRSDLALLKIEAGADLPVVRIGSSADMRPGEWVLAIGSPFGFDYSVTSGIISAKGRSLPNESYVPFIQTDVAINPGNSGGPLFNLAGEVIGINSQIFTRSGGFMGLSFAIPVDVAMDVVEQLKETGTVRRGWLGVVIQEVNKDLAESFGLPKPAGALVAQVMPEGPAAKGGLEVGDVILKFNDREIVMSSDLPHAVGLVRPGKRATLEVMRDKKRLELEIEIGALPEEDNVAASSAPSSGPSGVTDNRLGINVSDLTERQKNDLGVQGGVVVSDVRQGPGAMVGLRPGDIITNLDNQAVESVEGFREVVGELPTNRSISMRVIRQGRASYITFRLAE
ncbi:MAG TPA: DegQ family serine endoprotease [Pseudomonas xinjiangensis]|uniref:Probable periplasmic serine endoprotease DegP-like n=2 Tax=root TaxID=1 RepID=A0A7V1BMS1_9GAMM|nr:DegQ family serine endoprotease [Halopseudomonas xinjiangensis]HEC46924.1 DegQ family serine endoprotease [Halopseudomonas xinjiangensis]